MSRLFVSFLLLLLIPSCAKKDDNLGDVPEVPAFLRGGEGTVTVQPTSETVVAAGVDPASLSLAQGGIAGLTAEEDLIITDPDDIEASERALAGLFSVAKKDWQESHTIAKRLSLTQSKPLLIVFTDLPTPKRGGSPAAATLEKELLANKEFAEWSGEHFVRLKLDYNVKDRNSTDPSKLELALKKEKYLKTLRKRYKVGGLPVMLVVASDGSVIQHIRGYSNGSSKYVWGLLRTAVVNNEEKQKEFEAKLTKRGYRRWKGRNDQVILARLAKYNDGEVLLIGANGVRYETKESNLSQADRRWIEEQKGKRAAQRGL